MDDRVRGEQGRQSGRVLRGDGGVKLLHTVQELLPLRLACVIELATTGFVQPRTELNEILVAVQVDCFRCVPGQWGSSRVDIWGHMNAEPAGRFVYDVSLSRETQSCSRLQAVIYTKLGELHKSMSRSLGTDITAEFCRSWLCCGVLGALTPLLSSGGSNDMSPGCGVSS